MSNRLQIRRGLGSAWQTSNTLLTQGELGLDTSTGKLKIGDGILHWNDLPYFGFYSSNFGNLTSSDGILNIIGGTGCVLGSGVSISIDVASTSTSGILTSTDWNMFNNKYSGLPNQTGKVNKFLQSDGVTESWQDAPVDASSSLNRAFVTGMSVALGGRR